MVKRKQHKFALICFVAVILLLPGNDGFGQENTLDVLNQKVTSIDVTSSNFNVVLGNLAYSYNVPVGVEVPIKIDPKYKTSDMQISIKDGSVSQVLHAITTVAPYYKWEEVDGVINLSPSTNNEPILNIVVQDFQVDNMHTDEISEAITRSPEVKIKLAEMGLSRSDTYVIPSGKPRENKRLSFHLHSVTVRDILNYIIRTTNNKFWVINRLGPNNTYFTIRIW